MPVFKSAVQHHSPSPRLLLTTIVGTPPRSHALLAHRRFLATQPPRPNMSVSTAQEAQYKRNPHPDFKKVEASRPAWEDVPGLRFTQTAAPDWAFGDGANQLHDEAAKAKPAVPIDPYAPGRPAPFNYKLLISAIVPRPIGFVSTISESAAPDGSTTTTTTNLAPFSYFNLMAHDPPMFVVGIASTLAAPKDTLRNLVDTRECVVNIISEHFAEAANACSVDAPAGASEWAVAGLTPAHDCETVRAPRVREAVFSVECRLDSVREFESRRAPGTKTGCMVVLEGTRFWAREDALNPDRNLLDPDVLRPVSRLGGITYGRTTSAFELPRPVFEKDVGGMQGFEKLKAKTDGEAERN
ncbi:hypothetical protein F4780DRAFT_543164 [Xylariomycetidae sp. FL0641]|nr:hypothetical protein F4780DRAFT_543164 [Xylariomycetidae sp. FL0641]